VVIDRQQYGKLISVATSYCCSNREHHIFCAVITSQQHSKHVYVAMNEHSTVEQLLQAGVFSVDCTEAT
jgi:hypothetical protein